MAFGDDNNTKEHQEDASYIADLKLKRDEVYEELITLLIEKNGVEGAEVFLESIKAAQGLEEKIAPHETLKEIENHQKVWSNNNKSALFTKSEKIALDDDLVSPKNSSWNCNIV